MIYNRLAAPLLLAVAFTAACATAPGGVRRGPSAVPVIRSAPNAIPPATSPLPSEFGPRLLVRHADMGVEVDKLDPAERRLTDMTSALGGYVEAAGARAGALGDARQLTLRVPAPQLDAAMDSVSRVGRITSKQVSAEDVTDQVVDLDARVASLKASRDRLRQLLDKATSVTDVITVEKELAAVQGELDSLESRLTQARGQVAMARLAVTLQPRHVLGPLGLAFAGVGWVVQKLFFIR